LFDIFVSYNFVFFLFLYFKFCVFIFVFFVCVFHVFYVLFFLYFCYIFLLYFFNIFFFSSLYGKLFLYCCSDVNKSNVILLYLLCLFVCSYILEKRFIIVVGLFAWLHIFSWWKKINFCDLRDQSVKRVVWVWKKIFWKKFFNVL
jgi:hypothetical protein